MLTTLLLALTMTATHASLPQAAPAAPGYADDIAQWRKEREAQLKADGGWLSVAGLYWLKEGPNTLGTGTGQDVVLPPGSAPAAVGVATLESGKVTLTVAEGVRVTLNGQPITTHTLHSDQERAPDRVVINDLTLMVIVRGNRIGFRLYDNNAKSRTQFTGMTWYPVTPAYRITAKFVPYDPPHTLPITNVLGDTAPVPCPGYVVFTLNGRECRLDAEEAGNGLFFNFRDATTGKATYPTGRFLDAPKPENGVVVLDFNRAHNPPCAFTAYATCPLPPRQNTLPVAIPAGEKTHHPVTR